ncbi:competence protein CoiA [Staphylococcus agnetis]|nr:competence protein CoiA [Staphylococcus agnetis]NJH78770.1 competence protein CoiA [Staphylococcus agnetis]PNY86344.1 competence protein CoiA [Staphylococcus agnetis]PTH65690.1 competence protein CoiA [Staphylococcus agnetis]TRW81866.1 competence protein CoiA [Staphylococcus agnetis]
MFMLTAMDLYNKQIHACDASKQNQYFCPICKAQLILKKGVKMVPHFAHHKKPFHLYHHSGESIHHHTMKQQVYTLLKQWYHDVQLEPYIEEIRQIPDLTVGRWAIEIQLSPININTLQKRTEKLSQLGYHVIWLTELPKFKYGMYELLQRHQSVIHPDTHTLYCLSQDGTKIIELSQLIPVKANRFIGVQQYVNVKDWFTRVNNTCTPTVVRKLSRSHIEAFIAQCRMKHSVLEPHLSLMYQLQLTDDQVIKLTGFVFPEQIYFVTNPILWQLTVLKALNKGVIPHISVKQCLKPRYFAEKKVDYVHKMNMMIHAYLKILNVT